MQNKGFVKIFAVALSLVCLFYLSFSIVTRYYTNKAKEYAAGDMMKESFYLDSLSTEKVWLNYTLKQAREMEINLGLDLKGGMNVVLELNVADVIRSLSGNNTNENFNKALAEAQSKHSLTSKDFITVFVEEYKKLDPNARLSAVFSTFDLKDKIKPESSDEEVIKVIREELKSAIDNSFNVLRTRIDRFGVVSPNIQRLETDGRILVELPGVKEPERVRKLLQGSANLEFWETYSLPEIYPALIQANNIIRVANELEEENKANSTETVVEEVVTDSSSTGIDALVSSLTEADSLASTPDQKQNPLFAVLMPNVQGGTPIPSAAVGRAHYKDTATVSKYLNMKQVKDLLPRNVMFKWTVKPQDEKGQYYDLIALKVSSRDGKAPLEGDVITDARDDFSQTTGYSEVSMTMNAEGAKKWARLTKENVGKSIAIVLDGFVYSFPRVNGEIPGGRSSITGDFTPEEAKDLANVLKSGKMAASIHIVQEDIVGPSLGQEAINDGVLSFAIALILLMIYMCGAYGLIPGMIANCALIVNIFFTLGILASFQAVLTLSGIAGMVLTLGMAVDANVLIYERTKEELRAGKNIKKAIEDGYKNAFSAIFDSNLTTIITGIVLFYFGTGPIRGFATTLIIGLVSSFITAVFLTRIVYEGLLAKGKLQNLTFTTRFTKNFLTHTTFNFLAKRKVGYILPLILIVIGAISLGTLGLNNGIDFTGGRNYVIRFDKDVNTEEIKDLLNEDFGSIGVITIGSNNQVRISTNYKIEDNTESVDNEITTKLYEGLTPLLDGATQEEFVADYIKSSQKVGPSMADDIKNGAILAIIFSMICMAIYILFRFRDISFSVGTIASIAVTVCSIIALYSLLWRFMPFSMEVDQTFIAAILTIIGYSMNDTVVVFDRIRETIATYPNRDRYQVINDALNSTLARTFSTSFSTMLVVITIFILGGSTIRSFTFAILLGIIIGTYSTLFIATPIAYEIQAREIKKKKAAAAKK
ncbi:MAG: protein translocase subunit SecDF [Bacteroidales bacterium]|nr:protein translocase subunit SecDF [Bacteroidales bacterium]